MRASPRWSVSTEKTVSGGAWTVRSRTKEKGMATASYRPPRPGTPVCVPDHVFAYGSLSEDVAAGAPAAWLRGYRRVWGVAMDNRETIPGYKLPRPPDGTRPDVCVAFLDLEPAPGERVGGVLLAVDDSALLAALDRRERQYERTDVTAAVEDPPGRVFAYLGRPDSRERLRRARAAGRAVVSAAYAASVARFAAATRPHGLPVVDLVRVEVPASAPAGTVRGMGKIEGSATEEINAPIERCYELAADVDH